jgi:hypothetical protein
MHIQAKELLVRMDVKTVLLQLESEGRRLLEMPNESSDLGNFF